MSSNVCFDVKACLHDILDKLPAGIELVAVSKFHPSSYIKEAYDEGQRVFGESHVQELQQKQMELPSDIKWHFIGHLQTNKVKYIAPYISMIDAVDSVKLLREINKQAQKNDRIIDVMLELHIACEETKYGFTLDECRELLADGEWRNLKNVRLRGIMMMASNTDDQEQIASEFKAASAFFEEIKQGFFPDDDYFNCRSWGMSHDYNLAISNGSNMVRVGTAIFGPRVY